MNRFLTMDLGTSIFGCNICSTIDWFEGTKAKQQIPQSLTSQP